MYINHLNDEPATTQHLKMALTRATSVPDLTKLHDTRRSTVLYLSAVGGSDDMRQDRAALVARLGGPTNNAAKTNSTYGPAPLKKWFLPRGAVRPAAHAAPDVRVRDGDALIVIGKVDHEEIAAVGDTTLAFFGGQGPGFNFDDQTKQWATENVKRVHFSPEGVCPSYNIEEWARVMAFYGPQLTNMRPQQIGSFLCSRDSRFTHARRAAGFVTSAFYNQWGLNACTDPGMAVDGQPSYWIKVVETFLVRKVLGRYPGCQLAQHVERKLNKLDVTKPVQETFAAVYEAYKPFVPDPTALGLFADAALFVCKNLNTLCYNAFQDTHGVVKAQSRHAQGRVPYPVGIKEYDAYCVHSCLRDLAGLPKPTFKEHYGFLLACMRTCAVRRANPGLKVAYAPALLLRRSIREKFSGDVHVWHDLGFDPQNDDWLAIQILQAVFE
jgi:hypothetical protein